MKSALITGASRGIGFETVLSFARAGYKVFATMRDLSAAENLRSHIAAETLDVHIYRMNVDSDDSVRDCIETVKREHGTIDVLINNAGIERHGSVEEMSMADFKEVMETNYFGVIRCIKAVLPGMREHRKGCIINVSSVAGKISNTPLGAYAASKHALEAISESLAQEVKQFNVKVYIVEPGIINTNMAQNISAENRSMYPQVRRFGALFEESLKQPTAANLVADTMLEIAKREPDKLRYPVGPDAIPFLGWRASMSDEEWVNWNAQSDEEWFNAVESAFGMNVRREYFSL